MQEGEEHSALEQDSALTPNPLRDGGQNTLKRVFSLSSNQQEVFRKQAGFFLVFGARGVFSLALLVFLMAGFAILFVKFTSPTSNELFTDLDRDGVWFFGLMFALYFALLIFVLVIWKKRAVESARNKARGAKRNRKHTGCMNNIIILQRLYSSTCGLNGRYYLLKLYFFEILEAFVQIHNLRTIYLCMLPVFVTSIFSAILIIDSMYRAHTSYRLLSNEGERMTRSRRNFIIFSDLVVDILFITVPLLLMYFGYSIWVTVEEAVQIVIVPAFSSIIKLRSLLLDTITRNSEKLAVELGLVARASGKSIMMEQVKSVPRSVNIFVLVLSVIFSLGLFIVLLIQAFADVSSCALYVEKNGTTNYFSTGCNIKVPFCKDTLQPNCDCAVINIDEHDMVELSDKMSTMTSLQSVKINNGPLAKLPPSLKELARIRRFDFENNRLKSFDIDVCSLSELLDMRLSFNQIKTVHKCLWKHESVRFISLSSNVGLEIPSQKDSIYLPKLQYIHVGNNSVLIPPTMGAEQFPGLKYMYLNGNRFVDGKLPDSFQGLVNSLQQLGVGRCGLHNLGMQFKWEESSLKYLDARENKLFNVSGSLEKQIAKKKMENYFALNPVCNGEKTLSLNCKALCSPYCWSEYSGGNSICDITCNSEICDYDSGDCL